MLGLQAHWKWVYDKILAAKAELRLGLRVCSVCPKRPKGKRRRSWPVKRGTVCEQCWRPMCPDCLSKHECEEMQSDGRKEGMEPMAKKPKSQDQTSKEVQEMFWQVCACRWQTSSSICFYGLASH